MASKSTKWDIVDEQVCKQASIRPSKGDSVLSRMPTESPTSEELASGTNLRAKPGAQACEEDHLRKERFAFMPQVATDTCGVPFSSGATGGLDPAVGCK